jgi:hypothetical protein
MVPDFWARMPGRKERMVRRMPKTLMSNCFLTSESLHQANCLAQGFSRLDSGVNDAYSVSSMAPM